MRSIIFGIALISLTPSCQQATSSTEKVSTPAKQTTEYTDSVVRVNVTQQKWSLTQPWDKLEPFGHSALGVVIGDNQILTTAEMASNVVAIELEDIKGISTIPATVVAVDPAANLAILSAASSEPSFLKDLTPVDIAKPISISEKLEIVQVENNGMALVSSGQLQGVDIISNYAPGERLLSYIVKASLQSASSSFSIPAFRDGKLLGLLASYDSEDQTSTFISPETIAAFLADLEDDNYQGFPVMGITAQALTDPNLRAYLEISDSTGGIYISTVRKGAPAEKAGLKKGDVITSMGGYELDLKGYYEDERYGRLFWTNIIRGKFKTGDDISLKILREGKAQELTATLAPRSSLRIPIPSHLINKAPNFVVKGGLIFQELSRPFLRNFGKNWRSNAPLELLKLLNHQTEIPEEKESIIILTAVIPTQISVGYDRLRNAVIEEVNGVAINSISDLDTAFSKETDIHTIKTNGTPEEIFLDAAGAEEIDKQLLQRGLPFLKRIQE